MSNPTYRTTIQRCVSSCWNKLDRITLQLSPLAIASSIIAHQALNKGVISPLSSHLISRMALRSPVGYYMAVAFKAILTLLSNLSLLASIAVQNSALSEGENDNPPSLQQRGIQFFIGLVCLLMHVLLLPAEEQILSSYLLFGASLELVLHSIAIIKQLVCPPATPLRGVAPRSKDVKSLIRKMIANYSSHIRIFMNFIPSLLKKFTATFLGRKGLIGKLWLLFRLHFRLIEGEELQQLAEELNIIPPRQRPTQPPVRNEDRGRHNNARQPTAAEIERLILRRYMTRTSAPAA
ncbi:hypothetical protein [Candidatus Similichlamydia laticola]|uniref:Uncharacterized protein n=1 Tax=Candidatus Similichlamydia laticola TaxID=2170265 RepID=A0A369KHE8_9BACT|nr:hypothetical protein [Candidatus Similichlamydia laticola]RDB31223.1 hypothetical protein HAT2_00703 [Candidatus Similichlamydia laticola]